LKFVAEVELLLPAEFELCGCHSRASALSGARGISGSGTPRAAATRGGDRKSDYFPPSFYSTDLQLRTLESKNYYLFGIYEQVEEWRTSEPHLRRTNLVFISESARNASRTKAAA